MNVFKLGLFLEMIHACFCFIMNLRMTIWANQQKIISLIICSVGVYMMNLKKMFFIESTFFTFPYIFNKFFSHPTQRRSYKIGAIPVSNKIWVVFTIAKLMSIRMTQNFIFCFVSMFFAIERIVGPCFVVALHTTKSYFSTSFFMLFDMRRHDIKFFPTSLTTVVSTSSRFFGLGCIVTHNAILT